MWVRAMGRTEALATGSWQNRVASGNRKKYSLRWQPTLLALTKRHLPVFYVFTGIDTEGAFVLLNGDLINSN